MGQQLPNGTTPSLADTLSERQQEEMEAARKKWAKRMDVFRQKKKPKRAFN